MVDIQIGDQVTVKGVGRIGVVRAIWGDYASVEFDGGKTQPQLRLTELIYLGSSVQKYKEPPARPTIDFRQIERESELLRLRKLVRGDFLNAHSRFPVEFKNGLLTDEDLVSEKARFVKEWVDKQGNLRSPDPEQARAIACVNGSAQVVARAGSGKTTTLVNRAVFLIKHCGTAPGEMLLLAFNRKAAREIRRSLLVALVPDAVKAIEAAKVAAQSNMRGRHVSEGELDALAVDSVLEDCKDSLPHVMTFHALAHAIVHPDGKLLYDGSDGDALGLSREVQTVIDEFLRNPRTHERVRALMIAHFREDWERIVDGGFHLSQEDQLALLRSLPRETLAGDFVKSAGEKVIADFLFERGVAYKYERNHWWDGVNYKPDFTIFATERSGVVIEYFGMAGDPKYDEQIERKRRYWSDKPHWKLIELFPSDVAGGDISDDLEREITAALFDSGIRCDRLTEEEVWRNIRARAIDRFTKAATAFIGRCRKKAWDPEEMAQRIRSHKPASPVEKMFLELGVEVFGVYLDRLDATGDEDFDGLLHKAADCIRGGVHTFANRLSVGDVRSLKYVCIDEFQDFSELFHRLIDALRATNPSISFFCVGDDWQAINGFAGSELRFFENFEEYFGASQRCAIPTNYRSAKRIVNVGNALMHDRGVPSRTNADRMGEVWTFDLAKFRPSLIELQRNPGDIITPLVGRLVHKFLGDGKAVVMLTRRNGLPWYVKSNNRNSALNSLDSFLASIRSMMPEDKRGMVTISTAHKYKGLEKPAVIILDAVARSYPLVHPDWPFYRIFGDDPGKITEDERRLFYVALTRAIDDLVIVTDGENQSSFLEEIATRMSIASLPIGAFPPVPSTVDPKILLKVITQPARSSEGGTYAIRDLLRASRFQYDGTGKFWERSFPASSFELNSLQTEPWALAAEGVHAIFHDERGRLIARYVIDAGGWHIEIDKWQHLRESAAPQAGALNLGAGSKRQASAL